MYRSLAIAGLLLAASPAVAQLALTPSQSEGPYYPTRLKPAETDNDLTRVGSGPTAKGEALLLRGTVVDPGGSPIAGARVEIWQTDTQGIYLHPDDANTRRRDPNFQFYGAAVTSETGAFEFRTILPSRYPGRPRHIHAKITAPGAPTLTTQFYFSGDPDLAADGIARRLGKALADISLTPTRGTASGVLEASVRVVVRRAAR